MLNRKLYVNTRIKKNVEEIIFSVLVTIQLGGKKYMRKVIL